MNDIRAKNSIPREDATDYEYTAGKHSICWASIFAGTIATMAVSFALFVLASSYGLAIASPWSGEGFSATAVGANAVIAVILIQWLSSAFGGFLTGRLRANWRVHTDEVCFRDTAHGFLTWALATLAMVVILNSAVIHIIKSSAAGAAFAVASSDDRSEGDNDPTAYFVDVLFRTSKPANGALSADTRMEAARILLKGFSEQNLNPQDKAYLSSVVASRAGISTTEAENRVENTIMEMKKTADAARKVSATLAIFTFLSLLIGAFIASVSAALGGHCRDDYMNR